MGRAGTHILLWPLRRVALRLYRPLLELTKGLEDTARIEGPLPPREPGEHARRSSDGSRSVPQVRP